MIVDCSVVLAWINDIEFRRDCLKLREAFEEGRISLKTTSFVKYEVLRRIAMRKIPSEVAKRLAHLLSEYLEFISEELDSRLVANSVGLSVSLGLSLSESSCAVLSRYRGEVYVTANEDLAKKLSSEGFSIQHVSTIF